MFQVLVLILLMSCNSNDKKVMKITKEKVIGNINVLRSAGFFEKYEELTNLQVYDSLYSIRKKKYSEIFKEPYDPGMELGVIELAEYDNTKLLFLDLEADVAKDNNVYINVINAFSKLSNNQFQPKEIKEKWESETGPIKVSFISNDSLVLFEPEYNSDWLHESVFTICQKELEKKNTRIVDCLSDDGMGYGQAIAIMRLSKDEQKILESKLNLKFSSD